MPWKDCKKFVNKKYKAGSVEFKARDDYMRYVVANIVKKTGSRQAGSK